MNDDYLWDKSGEPDPEIQELEEILAPLRYQPKPLELPEDLPRRNYFPILAAIAATVLIALAAGGAWFKLRTEKSEPPQQAKAVPSVPSVPVYREPELANNTGVSNKPVRKRSLKRSLNPQERKEALEAKEQLMLALRVASEKLKLAQKRTLGPSPNQIKNQHKVG
jgi:hypothetical protein